MAATQVRCLSSERPHAAIGRPPVGTGRRPVANIAATREPAAAAGRSLRAAGAHFVAARRARRRASPRIVPWRSPSDRTALPRRERWRRFALRGVRSEIAALLIALCLWATFHQDLGVSLVYSLCISTMCWLLIDLGRGVVAARMPSSVGRGSGRWPGWVWMVALVVIGGVLGYAAGNEIANRLTGLRPAGSVQRRLARDLVAAGDGARASGRRSPTSSCRAS